MCLAFLVFGVISVWSNLDPKMVHDLVGSCVASRRDFSARELQLQYLDLVHALFCEVNPIPAKVSRWPSYGNYGRELSSASVEDDWKSTLRCLENAMRKAGLLMPSAIVIGTGKMGKAH